jgi:hypothetical protein
MATKILNPIHIKLDFQEAKESKKAILSSEINLIKLNKILKRYQLLRTQELVIKEQLKKNLSEIKKHILELSKKLPSPEIPSILKHGREKQIIESTLEKEEYDNSLEKELKEIKRQLASLQE